MSTVDVTPRELAHRAAPVDGPGISILRLFQVELRKQVDTRAGAWLLAVTGLVSVALAVLTLCTTDPSSLTWKELTGSSSFGLMLVLPLIGVLAATSEWSMRTALTTFALEPRRTRVNLAKLTSAWLLGLAVLVISLGVCAVLNVVGQVWRDGNGSWDLDKTALAGTALVLVLLVTQGVAFGLALLNTPTAIVVYLGLPTAWSILMGTVDKLEAPAKWLDLNVTVEPLMAGQMTDQSWLRLGVSVAVWIVLPLAVGLWRTARKDVA
jgi:hypothetical protein